MEPAAAEFLPERSLLGRAAGGLTGRARVAVPKPRALGSRARAAPGRRGPSPRTVRAAA
jgi:hypothetical protein